MYSANRQKIDLTLSPNDIGVNFGAATTAAMDAERFVRASFAKNKRIDALEQPRRFAHMMLLHQPGASRTAVATVRNALPSRLTAAVRRTTPVFTENASGLRLVATREITVRFKSKVPSARQNRVLADLGLIKDRSNVFQRKQFVITPTADIDETVILEYANRLAEHDDIVEYAAPNFIAECRKAASTNDPQIGAQWHLDNTGQFKGAVTGEDVRAFAAWNITPGGNPKIVIAIVDDGVDIRHPDLRDNIWVNPDRKARDRNGRNFVDNNFDPSPSVFHKPFDDTGTNDIHGTCCAGVAAAVGQNGRGVAGIAYRCKILPVKIFAGAAIASNEHLADAIRYAGLHADVISCSWATSTHADVQAAIDDVTRTGRGGKGTVFFAATGNENASSIGFPASHPNAIGVGASNDQARRASYSNHGRGISILAPSGDDNRPGITTTDVSARNRGYNLKGAYANDFDGTSSATPLAAGVGALVLSVNPGLKWNEVRSLLQQSADKIDASRAKYSKGFSLKYGYGRINALRAIQRASKTKKKKRR
jgi:hypothetical protein